MAKFRAGLEAGNRMGLDHQSRVGADIPTYFTSPLFGTEAAKRTDINRFAFTDCLLNHLKKGVYNGPTELGIKAGLLTDPVEYILLCHVSLTGSTRLGCYIRGSKRTQLTNRERGELILLSDKRIWVHKALWRFLNGRL
jgi:hypothetical protein